MTMENESQTTAKLLSRVHDPALPFLPLAIEELHNFSANIRIAFTSVVRRDVDFNPGLDRVSYVIHQPRLIESWGVIRFAYDPSKRGDLFGLFCGYAKSRFNFTLPCWFEYTVGEMKVSFSALASGIAERINTIESEVAGGGISIARVEFDVRLPFHAKCRYSSLEVTVHDQANAEIGALAEIQEVPFIS